MNLIEAYIKIFKKIYYIDEIPIEEFKKILNSSCSNDKIEFVNSSKILMASGKIISCVKNYYKLPEGEKIKNRIVTNNCFFTQKQLNINCSNYDCVQCHLDCIQKFENNKLDRI